MIESTQELLLTLLSTDQNFADTDQTNLISFCNNFVNGNAIIENALTNHL